MDFKLKKIYLDYIMAFICCIGGTLFVYLSNIVYKITIVVFCAIALCLIIIKYKIKIIKLRFFLNWMCFTLWSAISVLWAYNGVDINKIIVLLLIGCTCLAINTYISTREQIDIYLNMVILSSILLELYLLYYYGISIFKDRFDNSFINANRAGTIFAVAAYFAMYLWYSKKKISYAIWYLISFAGVLISGSKTSMLSCSIMCVGFIVIKDRKKWNVTIKNILIITIIAIVVFLMIMKIPILYNIIGERIAAFMETFSGENDTDKSTLQRMYLIRKGMEVFKQRPLIGVGIDNFRYFNNLHTYAHSNIVELLASVGLIGCILFYRLYYIIIREMHYNGSLTDEDKAFVIAYLLEVIIINFSNVYYYEMIDIVVLCVMYCFASTKSNCKKIKI
jgi:O-antigen ligase